MRDGDWKVLARLVDENGQPIKKHVTIFPGNAKQLQRARLADFEVFKVTSDIAERQELSSSMPDQFDQLRQKLTVRYHELLSDSPVWRR